MHLCSILCAYCSLRFLFLMDTHAHAFIHTHTRDKMKVWEFTDLSPPFPPWPHCYGWRLHVDGHPLRVTSELQALHYDHESSLRTITSQTSVKLISTNGKNIIFLSSFLPKMKIMQARLKSARLPQRTLDIWIHFHTIKWRKIGWLWPQFGSVAQKHMTTCQHLNLTFVFSAHVSSFKCTLRISRLENGQFFESKLACLWTN